MVGGSDLGAWGPGRTPRFGFGFVIGLGLGFKSPGSLQPCPGLTSPPGLAPVLTAPQPLRLPEGDGNGGGGRLLGGAVRVACGDDHTVIATADGRLFGCGANGREGSSTS